MFSNRFKKITKLSFNLATLLGNSPLQYDGYKFSVDSSVSRRLILNFALVCIWITFTIPNVWMNLQYGKFEESHTSTGHVNVVTLLTIVASIMTFYPNELCKIVVGYTEFFNFIHKKYMPQYDSNTCKINYILDGTLIILVFSYVSVLFQYICVVVYDPASLGHLGAMLDPKYLNLTVKLLIVAFHVSTYAYIFMNNLICAYLATVYGFYVVLIYTRELRLGAKYKYMTTQELRLDPNLQHAFRSLQVLHKNALSIFGIYLVLFNGFYVVCAVYMNFILIRYFDNFHGKVKLLLVTAAVTTMGSWTIILEAGKQLLLRGNKVLMSWKTRSILKISSEDRVMSRFIASCKPLTLSYGTMFVIRKTSVAVYYRGVVRGTCRALLSFK